MTGTSPADLSPVDLSVTEAGAALRAGRLTSSALTTAHLERIGALNARLHAFVSLCEGRARRTAARADRELAAGHDRGPLHGIPFAVKDLIDVAGLPTLCGSRAMPTTPAVSDAPVVARLVAAGAVPLGKLATYEFALTGPGFDGPSPPAVNPWDPGRISGGSSSGAAVAVAAAMVRIGVGTDTGGSIRSPASFCGVVGLKPRHALVPCQGVYPLSPTLDHVGPIAASVAEAALMLDAMAPGAGAADALTAGVAGLDVGFARGWFDRDPATDPGVLDVLDRAVSVLARAGARVRPIPLPDYAPVEAVGAVILHAEAWSIHRERLHADGSGYGAQARRALAAGAALSADDVAGARRAAARLRDDVDEALSRLDAIVTATTLAPAPRLAAFGDERPTWTPIRTLPFNLTGHPAISVPAGFVDGLPVGMQIVAAHGRERMLCRIGAAFEAATDHHARRPSRVEAAPGTETSLEHR